MFPDVKALGKVQKYIFGVQSITLFTFSHESGQTRELIPTYFKYINKVSNQIYIFHKSKKYAQLLLLLGGGAATVRMN